MERFTGAQRAFCVKNYYKNGDSCIVVRRLFRKKFRLHDLNQCPSESVIRSWIRKFECTGSTLNQKRAGRPRSIRTQEAIDEVNDSIQCNPGQSTRTYFCQHCNDLIDSINEACNHKCFRGKEHIYQYEDSSALFVDNYVKKENDAEQEFKTEDFEIHNSSSSGYTANVESHEDLSDPEELKAESNAKKSAVWTKKATMAMISLYEANILVLLDIGKQSQVWKKISEGLSELCIQVTADQVKWKFNRLKSKYKECIDNNSKSGRDHMTFEYYEQFEQIFHKEKNFSTPRKFCSIFCKDEKNRQHDVAGLKNINKYKKIKFDTTYSGKNPAPVDESSKLKTSSVAGDNENSKSQQCFQSVELLQNILENQKAKDEKMIKYLKMKEKVIELKKKSIDVRETEIQVKKDVENEKLKFNEKKHKDWLNIEKLKCELLKKLVENHNDGEKSDLSSKSLMLS